MKKLIIVLVMVLLVSAGCAKAPEPAPTITPYPAPPAPSGGSSKVVPAPTIAVAPPVTVTAPRATPAPTPAPTPTPGPAATPTYTGQIKATAKVAESLFRKATGDGAQSVTAAIFWLKTRGGWRETPQDHHVRLGFRSACEYSDEELIRIIGIDDPRVSRTEAAVTARRMIEVNPVRSG